VRDETRAGGGGDFEGQLPEERRDVRTGASEAMRADLKVRTYAGQSTRAKEKPR